MKHVEFLAREALFNLRMTVALFGDPTREETAADILAIPCPEGIDPAAFQREKEQAVNLLTLIDEEVLTICTGKA